MCVPEGGCRGHVWSMARSMRLPTFCGGEAWRWTAAGRGVRSPRDGDPCTATSPTTSCSASSATAFPTPPQFRQIGGGNPPAKNRRPFWPLLATPGRGQTISGAAAMPVPSSIDTGTPAPAIRLPLDPAPTHPRERPFRRNRACDLIFKRDRQRCGDGASPKRPVCHSHSPHPQLPT